METKKYFLILIMVGGFVIFSPSLRLEGGQVGGAYVEASPEFPLASDRDILVPEKRTGAQEPELSAQGVLVRDRNSGVVLLEKNSSQVLPIASLTKLMTAIVVYKSRGLREVVEIKSEDAAVPSYKADFAPGEKLEVKDLVSAMLVASANDAAMALARFVGGSVEKFVEAMNKEAQTLGMKNTKFANPVGLDDPNHYSSAKDLGKLVEEILNYPELVEITGIKDTTISSIDGKYTHELLTTNKLLTNHEEVVGLKTGFTTEAQGNLIILVDDDDSLWYSIILGSPNREAETEKILNWVWDNFIWK